MNSINYFTPKIISVFREGYYFADFKKDLIAGIILGVIAIPLSIAFAIASGARPEQGMITAVVAGFIASCTSGTRFQISGPTGAFIILVGSTISKFGYGGMLFATFLAGIFLIVSGISRIGNIIKFIPYTVTIGFTGGIAILIASSQIPDFLGIALIPNHYGFFEKWYAIVWNFTDMNFNCVFIGIISILILMFWPKLKTSFPSSLVVILSTTLIVRIFSLPCITIGDRCGRLEFTLPTVIFPSIEIKMLPEIVQAALAIAFLAGIESLLSALVADGMTGRRHRSQMELISQGLGNIGSSLVGGLPSTGAIARTAANIQSGCVSPVSGMIHSLVILLLMIFLGSYVSLIPLSAMSAILIVIAYRMGEWRHFLKIFRCPVGDIAILLSTFFLTIIVDLLTAIQIGIILAGFISIYNMAEVSGMKDLREAINQEETPEDLETIQFLKDRKDTEIYEIYGSLFFAAMEKFMMILSCTEQKPRILILRMRHVMTIDASGIRLLFDLLEKTKKSHTCLVISGVSELSSVYQALVKSGFIAACGKEKISSNFRYALEYARKITEKEDQYQGISNNIDCLSN